MSPGLPRLVVVTDRRMAQASGHRLVDVVSAVVSAVAPAPPVPEGATGSQVPMGVLLREKDLAPPARAALAAELRAVLDRAGGAVLLVAGDVDLAGEVGADAVHLAAADPVPSARPGGIVLGRSCHTVADLRRARADGLDYASLSPVFATPSKPGHGPALGIAGLAGGCRAVPDLPLLALGGIGPGRAAACIGAGARGVAVMGEIMRAADPADVVRRLLDELAGSGEPEHPSRRTHA